MNQKIPKLRVAGSIPVARSNLVNNLDQWVIGCPSRLGAEWGRNTFGARSGATQKAQAPQLQGGARS